MNASPMLTNRRAQVAALALFTFAVYALALWNGFAYDDVVIIRSDPRVTEFQLGAIFNKPYWTAPGFALYRPFVTLSFAADWALANGGAAWFHAVNGLWHAAATGALFVFLLAFFRTGPALFGALVFAVHPVHVEAVANVVGRAELMAGALFLLACALWAHERPAARSWRCALVSVLYVLAMLCKESAATLPAVLVLIDAARGRWAVASWPAQLKKRAAEYGTLAVLLIALLVIRSIVAGGATPSQLDPLLDVTRTDGDRVRTALQVWPHYLRLLVFPYTLLADYGPRIIMPAAGWTPTALLGLLLALALVLGGLLLLDRERHLAALTLLWLPITVLPVANLLFPIGVLLAERTLYIPSVAVSLAGALLIARAQGWPVPRARAAFAACAVVLALFVVRVQIRIPDWDSTDSIMMATRRDRPDAFRAEWHAARMARRDRDVATALQRYQYALQLWPYRERLVLEAAAYAGAQRDTARALRIVRWGTERWPANLQLQRMLAANSLDAGDTTTARRALAAGLRLAPGDSLLLRMSSALNPAKATR